MYIHVPEETVRFIKASWTYHVSVKVCIYRSKIHRCICVSLFSCICRKKPIVSTKGACWASQVSADANVRIARCDPFTGSLPARIYTRVCICMLIIAHVNACCLVFSSKDSLPAGAYTHVCVCMSIYTHMHIYSGICLSFAFTNPLPAHIYTHTGACLFQHIQTAMHALQAATSFLSWKSCWYLHTPINVIVH